MTALILGAIASTSAHAVKIEEVSLNSHLNSPLSGVLLIGLDRDEVIREDELEIRLASRADHQAAGLPYPEAIKGLQVQLKRQYGQTIEFTFNSPLPINEPIISLILELEWDTGKQKKEITLLLDPADYQGSISPENQNLLKPGDYIGALPTVNITDAMPLDAATGNPEIFVETSTQPYQAAPAPKRKEAPPRPKPSNRVVISEGEYGPVRSGDTLSKIAAVAARNQGLDHDTMIELIYDANPEAFSGSPNRLIRGATLQIPQLRTSTRTTRASQDAPPETLPIRDTQPVTSTKPLLKIVANDNQPSSPSGEQPAPEPDGGTGSAAETPAEPGASVPAMSQDDAMQTLQLENQTLRNEKFELENNLSHAQEQLGSLRNELDRLVVEFKALSQLQAANQPTEQTLAEQIERWLPWLLLFMTLPAVMFMGLRGRPQAVAPAPIAPAAKASADPASGGIESSPTSAPRAPLYSSAAAASVPAAAAATRFSVEETVDSVPASDRAWNDAAFTQANPPAHALPPTGEPAQPDETVANIPDGASPPTLEQRLADFDTPEQQEEAAADQFDKHDEFDDIPPERKLASMPLDNDTQEVIRSTLNHLEATQLIQPGQMMHEPEHSLDAAQEAEIYIAYDQFSLAEKTINRLLAEDPHNDRYLLLQLKLFAESGNMEDLQDLSVKMLHKHPSPDDTVNQRIRSICNRAFTQTNLRHPLMPGAATPRPFASETNIDNDTVIENMTAETLFVDGVDDFIADATLSEDEELRAGFPQDSDKSRGSVEDEISQRPDSRLGSHITELPESLRRRVDSTEIFSGEPGSTDEFESLLGQGDIEETLSDGLDLPFDLESEIRKYESELEQDMERRDS